MSLHVHLLFRVLADLFNKFIGAMYTMYVQIMEFLDKVKLQVINNNLKITSYI